MRCEATGVVVSKQASVFDAVRKERVRQEQLRREGRFAFTCADRFIEGKPVLPAAKLVVLVEEVGEVARAICDGDDANLREELVQVAAVCVAWLEALEEPLNHNKARCGCGALVTLPSLKARAYSARCDACSRKAAAAINAPRTAVAVAPARTGRLLSDIYGGLSAMKVVRRHEA